MPSPNDLDLLNETFGTPGEDAEVTASQPDATDMVESLRAEDKTKRMIAARYFCDHRDERAIAPLINIIATNDCPLTRVSAAYALGRNPSAEAVPTLIELLENDWNGYVRKGVVWALGNCGDRRAVEPLIHALKTDISAVRLWAASSVAQVAKLEYDDIIQSIPPLIAGLRRDKMAAVRSNCAWSLGQLCREMPSNVIYATAIDALIESLVEDEDIGVKEDARAALLRVGDPNGLQMIEELEAEGLI
ncbi:PBS lyase HEAT domain protein repeat-containing protein [[Leptolyngbya] sp. PCC 7376]|uniref:HEAT repeat domain-containing protein n=1 Tax=[Leptolyngbya] sp. PCC 7376 TaxID=111781 RepID=UPI00029ED5F8|nr:HEAT repeat domain-containing protein [[Leptolyngbya] sp. PCC 7376]AFY39482.1 PBS lyase HEAT domain protein repeat-containing protein [[Leptolyngbya] sp. PCC 7376]